ncbi:MAG: hypothetical protein CMO01_27850 [Thalassobius sp.]|nr:hypothetical protein [Thalassovita sp.]|tara:strand:- start:115 stop:555 length:441 start_codon:yes stop_codon:yes gene_type:complete
MTKEEYSNRAKYIWSTYVPKRGQSEFVQGELLRAIEKLRYEAQNNGNVNFSSRCHITLLNYLREKLSDKNVFDTSTIEKINKDLDKLDYPDVLDNEDIVTDEFLDEHLLDIYVEDDLYDRIGDRIVDWDNYYKEGIPRERNENLYC